MNKNITQSIQKNLYTKVAQKIDEMRKEISASLFEFYTGSHDTGDAPGEVEQDYEQEMKEDCEKHIKENHPNATTEEKQKLMDKCMGHSIQEAKKPANKPVKKPKPQKPAPAPEMAPIRPEARQDALDLMARIMLGMGTVREEKLPSAVLARRKAGGMKNAETKPLGFRGKHPGKG